MVDLSKVSEAVKKAVAEIAKMDGKKGITSQAEHDKLGDLLAGTTGKVNKEYIEGFMIDWQKKEKESKISDSVKKTIDKIAKQSGDKKTIDNDTEAVMLATLLINTNGEYSEEDLAYIRQVLIDSGFEKYVLHGADTNSSKSEETTSEAVKENGDTENNSVKKDYTEKEDASGENEPAPQKPNPSPAPTPTPTPLPVVPVPPVVDHDHIDDKDGIDDKDYVDNKGATQSRQGGHKNININGNNNTIILNSPESNQEVDTPEPDNDGKNIKKADELTPKEIKEARERGEIVAEALVGRTNSVEQELVKDILEKELNSANVIEFLKGYENNNGMGEHFFEQLRSEYKFPEQELLMRKVAEDLQVYLENKYGVDSAIAKEVAVVLLENTLDKEAAKKLDDIALGEVRGKEQKPSRVEMPTMGLGGIVAEHIKKVIE